MHCSVTLLLCVFVATANDNIYAAIFQNRNASYLWVRWLPLKHSNFSHLSEERLGDWFPNITQARTFIFTFIFLQFPQEIDLEVMLLLLGVQRMEVSKSHMGCKLRGLRLDSEGTSVLGLSAVKADS